MYQNEIDEITEILKMAKEAGLDIEVFTINEAGEVCNITEKIGKSVPVMTLEAAKACEDGLSDAEVESLLNAYFAPNGSESEAILKHGRSLPMRLRGFYGLDEAGPNKIGRNDSPEYGWRFYGKQQNIREDAAFYIEHLEARIKKLEVELEGAKADYFRTSEF